MTTNGYQEPLPLEFLSSKIFWLLGFVIAVNGYWINEQIELFLETQQQPTNAEDTSQLNRQPSKRNPSGSVSPTAVATSRHARPLWLQPHITSRPRQILAIIVCSLVLPLQLLEGSWVLKTAWRITDAVYKSTSSSVAPWLIRVVLHGLITLLGLVAWVVVLMAGVFLVVAQFLYILRLQQMQPGVTLHL